MSGCCWFAVKRTRTAYNTAIVSRRRELSTNKRPSAKTDYYKNAVNINEINIGETEHNGNRDDETQNNTTTKSVRVIDVDCVCVCVFVWA